MHIVHATETYNNLCILVAAFRLILQLAPRTIVGRQIDDLHAHRNFMYVVTVELIHRMLDYICKIIHSKRRLFAKALRRATR